LPAVTALQSGRSTLEPVSEEARISSVIFDYAGKIGRATDTDATLHLNAALARDLVGADRCSIWLIDAHARQLWTKVAHGVEELRIPLGEGVIGACIAQNQPIVVNDASQDARFHGGIDEKTGYATRSLLAIPLTGSNGNVIGALQVLNKPGGFDDHDVNLLGLAAAYSASAIEAQLLRRQVEASRLLQRELEIAREVQERLFPQQLPLCPGLDLAAVCRPARAVGGDYFDFIPLPGGELLFTLGDVSGKGIAAAVLMAGIQASIRSQVLRPPESLAALVGDFNRAVFSLSTSDKYSTLFCGLLNPETRRLTYVNAAQVPPVLVRAAGSLERLEDGGTAIGMFPLTRYRQAVVNLEPGDAVVCFSDGISEATSAQDEMWDEAQYLELLQRSAHLGARGIVEALVAGADAFAGETEQADDMTVVVLKAVSVAEKP
jgi:sigma-B regulation protein RsbU (phosphoserine phosphatase)